MPELAQYLVNHGGFAYCAFQQLTAGRGHFRTSHADKFDVGVVFFEFVY